MKHESFSQTVNSCEIRGGIWAAIPTPFNASAAVNTPTLVRLVKHLDKMGLSGIYICGSTGEGYHLNQKERCDIVDAVLAAKGSLGTIVHVGAANPEESKQLAAHAAKAGADAISSMIPFVGGYTTREIKYYYESLAGENALPLMVYYMPAGSQNHFGLAFLQELLSISNIRGIKYTEYDLGIMRNLVLGGSCVFYGRDEMLAAGIMMGAAGAIGSTYSIFAKEAMDIERYVKANKQSEAIRQQDRINAFLKTALTMPYLNAVKQVLTWQGFDMGTCRFPRERLNEPQALQLRKTCQELELI